jgi:hypothetical protein
VSEEAYWIGRFSGSISRPHGRFVGLPKSSWFHQLPKRPIPCASIRPGAAASISANALLPARLATMHPTIVPSRIPPQTPRPPFQTMKTPCHLGSGTSDQLVITW